MVLALAALLALWGASARQGVLQAAQARLWMEELEQAVAQARLRALRQGSSVSVCAGRQSAGACGAPGQDWAEGYWLRDQISGAALAEPRTGLPKSFHVQANRLVHRRIRISGDGAARASAGRLTVCRGGEPVVGLVIATSGRTRATTDGENLPC